MNGKVEKADLQYIGKVHRLQRRHVISICASIETTCHLYQSIYHNEHLLLKGMMCRLCISIYGDDMLSLQIHLQRRHVVSIVSSMDTSTAQRRTRTRRHVVSKGYLLRRYLQRRPKGSIATGLWRRKLQGRHVAPDTYSDDFFKLQRRHFSSLQVPFVVVNEYL